MNVRAVQFSPKYCEEAKGTKPTEWDSSHDLSLILDGRRERIGNFRHAHLAYAVGKIIEENEAAFRRHIGAFHGVEPGEQG